MARRKVTQFNDADGSWKKNKRAVPMEMGAMEMTVTSNSVDSMAKLVIRKANAGPSLKKMNIFARNGITKWQRNVRSKQMQQ